MGVSDFCEGCGEWTMCEEVDGHMLCLACTQIYLYMTEMEEETR